MGLGEITIHKIKESGQVGYYEVSSEHFDMKNFYMRIDKLAKTIQFFTTKNFDERPMRTIDYNKDEKMGYVPGVPTTVLGIVLLRAFKVLKMDTFPESLSYAA